MNIIDKRFYDLTKEIKSMGKAELFARMKSSFDALPAATKNSLAAFFARYGYWGRLEPENGVYEEIELKADALKEHADDFVWLYERLADFRSKKVLFSVLSNWYRYDFDSAAQSKEYCFDDYFDLDLVKCSASEVIADLGAYIGDTVVSYLVNYGADCYKKIYCYEITPEIFAALKETLSRFERIDCRLKGVADKKGVMRLSTCAASSSANTLGECGDIDVEVTTLDDDIAEPLTMIKADIEGFEYKALLGAARHIREDRPKLLISVYHNNEDLWRIPRLIDAISPSYTFRLRHKGSPLYPTEITLLAL